jgi:hypothetical protein
MTGKTLIVTDIALVAVATMINVGNGGFDKSPLFLNFLFVTAFAITIIRHINYYKLTKKIY